MVGKDRKGGETEKGEMMGRVVNVPDVLGVEADVQISFGPAGPVLVRYRKRRRVLYDTTLPSVPSILSSILFHFGVLGDRPFLVCVLPPPPFHPFLRFRIVRFISSS